MSRMLRECSLSKRVLLLLGAYFVLQLVVRLSVSPALELDEAEQLLLTQQLSLGYGSQPPLYTWLQSGLFSLFGVNIFSLALLKNLLLCLTYLLVYRTARSLGYDAQTSVAAMLSLFFIPQIAWESQRDLTHSVLATTITAATIVAWLQLKQNQSIRQYILVGLCWGVGILAKYNYVIFLVSLLAASYTVLEYRLVMLRPRILYAFAAMVALVMPHALWAANNRSLLMTSSSKFKQAAEHGYFASIGKGAGSLAVASLAFAAPLLAIYALVWYRNRRHRLSGGSDQIPMEQQPNLLLRCILSGQAVCLLMVLLFQVTAFKDRWMQPILFFLPLALLPVMHEALGRSGSKTVRTLAAAVAVVVMGGLASRAVLAPITGDITRFNLPYPEISGRLATPVRSADLVLAQNPLLGGNLRLRYPSVHVAIPGGARLYHDSSPRKLLVVWQDGISKKQSDSLWGLAATLMGEYTVTPSATVQAPLRYMPDKTVSLSYTYLLKKG